MSSGSYWVARQWARVHPFLSHTTPALPDGGLPYGTLEAMARDQNRIEADPVIEAFKKDIDRTLLRANLKLTTGERLRKLSAAVRGVFVLREAMKKGGS